VSWPFGDAAFSVVVLVHHKLQSCDKPTASEEVFVIQGDTNRLGSFCDCATTATRMPLLSITIACAVGASLVRPEVRSRSTLWHAMLFYFAIDGVFGVRSGEWVKCRSHEIPHRTHRLYILCFSLIFLPTTIWSPPGRARVAVGRTIESEFSFNYYGQQRLDTPD